jgi:hypothetical protein
MRHIILLGAISAALAASESVAYALPPNSPYAILVPESVDRGVVTVYDHAIRVMSGYGIFAGQATGDKGGRYR